MKSPGDKYLQYMAGWHAGAGCQPIDPKRAEHEDKEFAAIYLQGWEDGKETSRAISRCASETYGYQPKIILAI